MTGGAGSSQPRPIRELLNEGFDKKYGWRKSTNEVEGSRCNSCDSPLGGRAVWQFGNVDISSLALSTRVSLGFWRLSLVLEW